MPQDHIHTVTLPSSPTCSRGSPPVPLHSPCASLLRQVFLAVILAALVLASATYSSAAIINEPMTGAAAPGWIFGGAPAAASLTGGSIDPAGQGWLRLTNTSTDQSGFAYFDTPFNISNGVVIQFDYTTWGGTGADGYSVFLFDGAISAPTFTIGASGGSLGYAPKTVAPVKSGLSGGYIGIGIDEYGNFSSPTEGRTGGPGLRTNSVAVRGPAAGNYVYVGGTAANIGQLWLNQAARPSQSGPDYRKVVIQLTPVPAPNYLRVDVYLQFGYNQPLTQVLSGLMIGQQPPSSVKIGYAASTGGSTNYHEVRNLVIDSLGTDINLSMFKTAPTATVSPGNIVTYTVTARNLGPNPVTAANVPIVDTVPPQLTGVTWTCSGSGGAVCGSASGSGNAINTTATLPFNSAAIYTVTSTVTATTPPGTVLTNTAALTPPAGVIDYYGSDNSSTSTVTVAAASTVSLSGMVYNDANHNGTRDGGEGVPTIGTLYAKLFTSGNTYVTRAVVNAGTGVYSFPTVTANAAYTVILSTNNDTTFTPGYTSTQWIYTKPVNYTLSPVIVGGVNVTNQDFGVFNGTRLSGRVFRDNGAGGGAANDGLQNGGEVGMAGITMSICNNAACTAIDTTTTGANGDYALFIAWGNAFTAGTARITQTIPAGNLMVNYSPGTATGTAVDTANGRVTLTFNRGTDRDGILFGDVQDNTFSPNRTQNGSQLQPVQYAHTFVSWSTGTVSFTVNSRSQAGWPALVLYQDTNCSGSFDGGDIALPAVLSVTQGAATCILVEETVPNGTAGGTTDTFVIRATYTFTGSARPASSTYDVTDTTTVVASPNIVMVKSVQVSSDPFNGTTNPKAIPGAAMLYSVTVTNAGFGTASTVVVSDPVPANTALFVGDLGAPGSGPVLFIDGTVASGLSYAFSGLGSAADSIAFSNDNGATWAYTPVPDANGYDAAVTNFRISLGGTFNNAAGGNQPSFTLRFQVTVK